MILHYLDLLENPGAFYTAVSDTVKRKLLEAYFAQIWIDDDGHEVSPDTQSRMLVAQIMGAARKTATNENRTVSMLGAAEHTDMVLCFHGGCSSKNNLVRPTGLEPVASCSGGKRSIH